MFALLSIALRFLVPLLEKEGAQWLVAYTHKKHQLIAEVDTVNWLSILSNIWKLAPYVVAGIETIHANETTETKTQLAQDALGIALAGSGQVLSNQNQATAQVVAGAVSQAIALSQNLITSLKTPAAVSGNLSIALDPFLGSGTNAQPAAVQNAAQAIAAPKPQLG